jgi:hypothetical protein
MDQLVLQSQLEEVEQLELLSIIKLWTEVLLYFQLLHQQEVEHLLDLTLQIQLVILEDQVEEELVLMHLEEQQDQEIHHQ